MGGELRVCARDWGEKTEQEGREDRKGSVSCGDGKSANRRECGVELVRKSGNGGELRELQGDGWAQKRAD